MHFKIAWFLRTDWYVFAEAIKKCRSRCRQSCWYINAPIYFLMVLVVVIYCQVILCYTLFSECDCQYIWCAILKKVYLYTLNCHFILYRYNKRSEHTSTFFILENKRRLIQFIVGISNSDFLLTGKVRSLFLNLEPFSKLAFTMNATSNATVVAQSMFLSCCSKTV